MGVPKTKKNENIPDEVLAAFGIKKDSVKVNEKETPQDEIPDEVYKAFGVKKKGEVAESQDTGVVVAAGTGNIAPSKSTSPSGLVEETEPFDPSSVFVAGQQQKKKPEPHPLRPLPRKITSEDEHLQDVLKKVNNGSITSYDLVGLYITDYGKDWVKKIIADNSADKLGVSEQDLDTNEEWDKITKDIRTKNRVNSIPEQEADVRSIDDYLLNVVDKNKAGNVYYQKSPLGSGWKYNEVPLPKGDFSNKKDLASLYSFVENSSYLLDEKGNKDTKLREQVLEAIDKKQKYLISKEGIHPDIVKNENAIQTSVERASRENLQGQGVSIDEMIKNDPIAANHFKLGLSYIKDLKPEMYASVMDAINNKRQINSNDYSAIAKVGQDIGNQQTFIAAAKDPTLIDAETDFDYESEDVRKSKYAAILSERFKKAGLNPLEFTEEQIFKYGHDLPNKVTLKQLAQEEKIPFHDAIPKTGIIAAAIQGVNQPLGGLVSTAKTLTESPAETYLRSRSLGSGLARKVFDEKGQASDVVPSDRDNIWYEAVRGFGQFIPQVALSRGMGGLLNKALGTAGSSIAGTVSTYGGTFVSTFLQTYGDSYAEALQKTGNPNTARLMGSIGATTAAAFELWLPDVKIADSIFRNLQRGLSTDLATLLRKGGDLATLSKKGRPAIQKFLTQYLDITRQEVSEEVGTRLVDHITESLFSPKTAASVNLTDELIETARATAVSMAIPAIFGGGSAALNKDFSQTAFHVAAINIDQYKRSLEKQVQNRGMSQQDYNNAISLLSSHKQSIDAAPKQNEYGVELTGKQQMDYALEETKIKGYNEKAKSVTGVEKEMIDKKIEASKEVQRGILMPSQHVPVDEKDVEEELEKEELRAANVLARAKLNDIDMANAEENPIQAVKDIAKQALNLDNDGNLIEDGMDAQAMKATEDKYGKEAVAQAIQLYPIETLSINNINQPQNAEGKISESTGQETGTTGQGGQAGQGLSQEETLVQGTATEGAATTATPSTAETSEGVLNEFLDGDLSRFEQYLDNNDITGEEKKERMEEHRNFVKNNFENRVGRLLVLRRQALEEERADAARYNKAERFLGNIGYRRAKKNIKNLESEISNLESLQERYATAKRSEERATAAKTPRDSYEYNGKTYTTSEGGLILDDGGNVVSLEEAAEIKSSGTLIPAQKAPAGNVVPSLKDEKGEPITFYRADTGGEFGNQKGTYFTTNKEYADSYTKDLGGKPKGSSVGEFHLNVQNPLRIETSGPIGAAIDKVYDQAVKDGHDAIIATDKKTGLDEIVVFDNKNIQKTEAQPTQTSSNVVTATYDMDDVQHNLGNTVPATISSLSDLNGVLSESGKATAEKIREKLNALNTLVDNKDKFNKEEALKLAQEAKNLYDQLGKTIPNRDTKIRQPMSFETEADIDDVGDVFDRVGRTINRSLDYLNTLQTTEQETKAPTETTKITLAGGFTNTEVADNAIKEINSLGEVNELNKQQVVIDGVKVTVVRDGGKIVLKEITAIDKGEGNGTKVLGKIKDIADQNNVDIILTPTVIGATSQEDLVKWYKENGFEDYTQGRLIYTPAEAKAPAEKAEPSLREGKFYSEDEVTAHEKNVQKQIDDYEDTVEAKYIPEGEQATDESFRKMNEELNESAPNQVGGKKPSTEHKAYWDLIEERDKLQRHNEQVLEDVVDKSLSGNKNISDDLKKSLIKDFFGIDPKNRLVRHLASAANQFNSIKDKISNASLPKLAERIARERLKEMGLDFDGVFSDASGWSKTQQQDFLKENAEIAKDIQTEILKNISESYVTPKTKAKEKNVVSDETIADIKTVMNFDEDNYDLENEEGERDMNEEERMRDDSQKTVKFKGASVDVRVGGENEVDLFSLTSDNKNQGEASALMDAITQSADETGTTLNLTAEEFGEGGLSQADLIKFYESKGFVFDGNEGVRTPAQPAAAQAPAETVAPSAIVATESSFPVSELNKMPKGRLHQDITKLKESIEKEGITEPLVLEYYPEDNTMRIKEGHHRLAAANELGIENVPVKVQVVWGKKITEGNKDIEGQPAYNPPSPLDVAGYESRNYQPTNIGLDELGYTQAQPAAPQTKTISRVVPTQPTNKPGRVTVTLSGNTEQERKAAIAQRKADTYVPTKVIDEQKLLQRVRAFNNQGLRFKRSTLGRSELNNIRIAVDSFNRTHRQKYTVVSQRTGNISFSDSKGRLVRANNKAIGDLSIDEKGVVLMKRSDKTKEVFNDLLERNLFPTGYTVDGRRMTESQLDGAIQDIMDGIPSRAANNYLDALDSMIEKDDFDFSQPGIPQQEQITLAQVLETEQTQVGEQMTEEAVLDMLAEQSNLTPEQEQTINDNLETLIDEYEIVGDTGQVQPTPEGGERTGGGETQQDTRTQEPEAEAVEEADTAEADFNSKVDKAIEAMIDFFTPKVKVDDAQKMGVTLADIFRAGGATVKTVYKATKNIQRAIEDGMKAMRDMWNSTFTEDFPEDNFRNFLNKEFDDLLKQQTQPKYKKLTQAQAQAQAQINRENEVISNVLSIRPDEKAFPTIFANNVTEKQLAAETQGKGQNRIVDGNYVVALEADLREIQILSSRVLKDELGANWIEKTLAWLEKNPSNGNIGQVIGILNVMSTDNFQEIENTSNGNRLNKLYDIQKRIDVVSNQRARDASLGMRNRILYSRFAQGDSMADIVADAILPDEILGLQADLTEILSDKTDDAEINKATPIVTTPAKQKKAMSDRSAKIAAKKEAKEALAKDLITQASDVAQNTKKTLKEIINDANEKIKNIKC